MICPHKTVLTDKGDRAWSPIRRIQTGIYKLPHQNMAPSMYGRPPMACFSKDWRGITVRSRAWLGARMGCGWRRVVASRGESCSGGIRSVERVTMLLWGIPGLCMQWHRLRARNYWSAAAVMANCAGGMCRMASAKPIRAQYNRSGEVPMGRSWRAVVMLERSCFGIYIVGSISKHFA